MPKFTKIDMSALRQADWTKKGKEVLSNLQKLLETNDALYKKELEDCQQKSKKDLSDFEALVKRAEQGGIVLGAVEAAMRSAERFKANLKEYAGLLEPLIEEYFDANKEFREDKELVSGNITQKWADELKKLRQASMDRVKLLSVIGPKMREQYPLRSAP